MLYRDQNYNRCGRLLRSSSLWHYIFKHLVRFSIQAGSFQVLEPNEYTIDINRRSSYKLRNFINITSPL